MKLIVEPNGLTNRVASLRTILESGSIRGYLELDVCPSFCWGKLCSPQKDYPY